MADDDRLETHLKRVIQYENDEVWEKAGPEHESIARLTEDSNMKIGAFGRAYACYLTANMREDAFRVWEELRQIKELPRIIFAQAYFQENKLEVAERVCLEALQEENGEKHANFILLGLIYQKMGKSYKAIEIFERVEAEAPNSDDVHIALSSIYESIEEWDKAGQTYEKIAEIKKEWTDAVRARAYACYLTSGNKAKSQAIWDVIQSTGQIDLMVLAQDYADKGNEKIVNALLNTILRETPEKLAQTYECRIRLYKKRGDKKRLDEVIENARTEGIEIESESKQVSLEKLGEYLKKKGWRYKPDPKKSILMTGWEGDHGGRLLFILLDEKEHTIQFVVPDYIECLEEGHLGTMAAAILGLNSKMVLSRLGMEYKTGKVTLSSGVIYGRDGFSEEAFNHCINALIDVDKFYFPLIRDVKDGKLTVDGLWERLERMSK